MTPTARLGEFASTRVVSSLTANRVTKENHAITIRLEPLQRHQAAKIVKLYLTSEMIAAIVAASESQPVLEEQRS